MLSVLQAKSSCKGFELMSICSEIDDDDNLFRLICSTQKRPLHTKIDQSKETEDNKYRNEVTESNLVKQIMK